MNDRLFGVAVQAGQSCCTIVGNIVSPGLHFWVYRDQTQLFKILAKVNIP